MTQAAARPRRRRSIRACLATGDTGTLTLAQFVALTWWQTVQPWGST
jgi:hypothetical protein